MHLLSYLGWRPWYDGTTGTLEEAQHLHTIIVNALIGDRERSGSDARSNATLVWKKQLKLRLGARYRDAGLVFCGPRGRPLNPSNIPSRDHVPRLERLGLPRTRLHDFRHFHATALVAADVDARTVADRLGHASQSCTLATYAHASARAQAQAAAIANALLTELGQATG